MEEDVPHCVVEKEEKCEDSQGGFLPKEKCMSWPVTRCKLVKKVVTKYTPSTKVYPSIQHCMIYSIWCTVYSQPCDPVWSPCLCCRGW